MLSASHNPAPDNGIKFLTGRGFKLPDAVENEIERRLGEKWERPVGSAVGRVRDAYGETERYVSHVLSSLPYRLDGLRVVVDCAHGAAHMVAPEALLRAGAEVETIGARPRRSQHQRRRGLDPPGPAARGRRWPAGPTWASPTTATPTVASRSTADGAVVDGDQIMAVLATAMRAEGRLAKDTVVATVMSNLGFKLAMREAGMTVVETAVGDRYVLERMRGRLHLRRRAVRSRDHARPRHHRRRSADLAAPAGGDGRSGPRCWRSWPR